MKSLTFFTKTLFRFLATLLALFAAVLLVWMIGVGAIYFREARSPKSPDSLYKAIAKDDPRALSAPLQNTLADEGIWMLVLDDTGKYRTAYGVPASLRHDYKTSEVAKFTRWYLEDHPVFTYVEGENIVVLGYPKDSYGKLASNYFQVEMTFRLLYLLLFIFAFGIFAVFLLYYFSSKKLNAEILPLAKGIEELAQNRPVSLPHGGELNDLKEALNRTSRHLEADKAERRRWIRGISHDIRTPLTVIAANAKSIEDGKDISHAAKTIEESAFRIDKILEGLNLTYFMEQLDAPENPKAIALLSLIRRIAAECIDASDTDFSVEIDDAEDARIMGDENLIDRAVRNLLQNSARHNKAVTVRIAIKETKDAVVLCIADDGTISSADTERLNDDISPRSANGFGIPIVKKILAIHGGTVQFAYGDPGLIARLIFPKPF